MLAAPLGDSPLAGVIVPSQSLARKLPRETVTGWGHVQLPASAVSRDCTLGTARSSASDSVVPGELQRALASHLGPGIVRERREAVELLKHAEIQLCWLDGLKAAEVLVVGQLRWRVEAANDHFHGVVRGRNERIADRSLPHAAGSLWSAQPRGKLERCHGCCRRKWRCAADRRCRHLQSGRLHPTSHLARRLVVFGYSVCGPIRRPRCNVLSQVQCTTF